MFMIDIQKALEQLSIKRPVFHSEADFQHALAWEMHQQLPQCSIRLEFKPPYLTSRMYVDIWVRHGSTIIAVELKYKTRGLQVIVGEETFDLLDQSAQDIGRYDFVKDIKRLEQIVSAQSNIIGYALLLTNDSSYWSHARNATSVDASFRIHDGRVLNGELLWAAEASRGTISHREEAIRIKGTYRLLWRDYSKPSTKSYGRFRSLLVKIEPNAT
jgi:hypothetical protein